jgi:pimeloyl-ACP methyl ester carboxylesterase
MNIRRAFFPLSAVVLLTTALMPFQSSAQNAPSTPVRNIVLVHGVWADGSSWSKVVPLLEAKGFHVVCVQNPLTSLADDVAATSGNAKFTNPQQNV